MVVSLIGDVAPERIDQALLAFWKQWTVQRPPLVAYERIDRPALDVKATTENIITPEKKNAIWLAQQRFNLADHSRSYQALRLAMRWWFTNGSLVG
jgi:hypothetical protein